MTHKAILKASWTHHRGLNQSSLYASLKAVIAYLVKNLSFELAEWKIRINAISPGYINTAQLNENAFPSQQAALFRAQTSPF